MENRGSAILATVVDDVARIFRYLTERVQVCEGKCQIRHKVSQEIFSSCCDVCHIAFEISSSS